MVINKLRGVKETNADAGFVASVSVACPICDERQVMVPYGAVNKGRTLNGEDKSGSSRCEHQFCYTCLVQRLQEGNGRAACPIDGEILTFETIGRRDTIRTSLI